MNDTQLRIGIIGINGRGTLSRYWHQPEGRSVVAGAADIREENLHVFREQCNQDAFITTDYRELLARDDIDAVAVTTPDFCHEEHACAALEAGKPVYCEKPMAVTIEGCDRMVRTARRTGRKLMIGFNMRYMRYVRKMKELVDAGAIGEVKAVWIRHFVGMGSIFYFHDWHADKKNTTSLLLQKGSHDFDVTHFVTGHYTRRVAAFGGLDFFGGDAPNDLRCSKCEKRDTCLEATPRERSKRKPNHDYCAFRREVSVPDNYVTIMELEGGIKASYLECHFTPDYQRNYTFIGTEGRIENSTPDNKIRLWRRRNGSHEDSDETFDVTPGGDNGLEVGHGGSDGLITRSFVDMVLDDKEPPVPMEAGRMSVAVGVLAQRSLENGGRVYEIPPMPQ